MKAKGAIFKVLVRLNLAYASGRDLLYGISQYARANCHWNIRLAPFAADCGTAPFPQPEDVDGIITSEPLGDAAVESKIPLVVIGTREKWLGRRMESLAFVRNNDTEIGRFGATFLKSLGRFRSFGFVPTNTPYYCSILMEEGFRTALEGGDIWLYDATDAADGSREDVARLGGWLARLPKPAAVMAVHDLRATHVLEAARARRIKVPAQLAVIGVDNDELLCDFTAPQLTSIFPDHVKEGELAAGTLQKMMAHEAWKRPHTFHSDEKTLVERESAQPISPASRLADGAMEYIRRNAAKGITAADVAEHLHVSRRLCDMRFRECHGETVLNAILRCRFSLLKHYLATTKVRIKKITAACGFACESHAKRMFRKRYGMSMREWREKNRAK